MNTRDKIYNAAKRLYLENGYANTPNTLIAKEAGVNLGLVTYYFKTKDIIASDMLNNNYETLYSHLLKYLPTNDELLQLITFFKLHFQLTGIDPHYDRFIYEMNKFDLLEKATRDGNLYSLYQTLVNQNDQIDESEKELLCSCAVTASFGVIRALTMKQYEKEILISKDEIFDLCINQMFYSLKIDYQSLLLKSLISSANCTVDRLLEEYPQLKEVKNYLYIEDAAIVCEQ
ncbi:TetR/AcrR family transcriptional regulator [uncultured Acetobacterium sp.]|jgi:AcrR family transcriptional regulator|uniref:TetR/AcrR family transcriptional regulator n=1 Tax=uncultured Acetobacterium sp. TaxID=217139 RepID=UPI002427997A|nr:TetR/AcrR family transcriptional regulator [uncultured Acetobacterium sp.]MBU4542028.1 TetR/AcrR family transcriptional regulator [Bacillota bacterium]